jgi:hypothetical protein
MFSNLKCAAREFLGIPQMQSRLVGALHNAVTSITSILERRIEPGPVLACITVLCDLRDDMPHGRSTVFGAEKVISPGESTTIEIPYPQRIVGRLSYFITGHPNLIIESFEISNRFTSASAAGVKFGQCNETVELGERIRARISYRVPGSL